MDLGLSEEQQILKATARDFLKKECPRALVRAMENDERGYPLELWGKMANLGWLGLVFPEEYGGTGGNFLDLVVLLEEMARALVPGPFVPTVVETGLPILYAGTDEQKHEFLPKIADGEIVLTLALTETDASYAAKGINVTAISDKDGYIINGNKLFVRDAHVADYFLCVTRTKGGQKKGDGITLFLVDAKCPGITKTMLRTLSRTKQCEVLFDNVYVPKKNVLGTLDQGWEVVEKLLEWAAVAQCALLVGSCELILEMTIDYAKQREQFNRPIGSFQAVQHKCVDMLVDLDGSRCITYEAAWRLVEGLPASKEVSMAKAWVSDASKRISNEAHQIHGSIGFTEDYDLQLYTRWAKVAQITAGDSDSHRELVAQQIGLQSRGNSNGTMSFPSVH